MCWEANNFGSDSIVRSLRIAIRKLAFVGPRTRSNAGAFATITLTFVFFFFARKLIFPFDEFVYFIPLWWHPLWALPPWRNTLPQSSCTTTNCNLCSIEYVLRSGKILWRPNFTDMKLPTSPLLQPLAITFPSCGPSPTPYGCPALPGVGWNGWHRSSKLSGGGPAYMNSNMTLHHKHGQKRLASLGHSKAVSWRNANDWHGGFCNLQRFVCGPGRTLKSSGVVLKIASSEIQTSPPAWLIVSSPSPWRAATDQRPAFDGARFHRRHWQGRLFDTRYQGSTLFNTIRCRDQTHWPEQVDLYAIRVA